MKNSIILQNCFTSIPWWSITFLKVNLDLRPAKLRSIQIPTNLFVFPCAWGSEILTARIDPWKNIKSNQNRIPEYYLSRTKISITDVKLRYINIRSSIHHIHTLEFFPGGIAAQRIGIGQKFWIYKPKGQGRSRFFGFSRFARAQLGSRFDGRRRPADIL